jgi:hypothetical protein
MFLNILFQRKIKCFSLFLYVLSSVLWCPLRFPHKNDVQFVFNSSCLEEGSCLIYVSCVYLYIVVYNVVSFSRLSISHQISMFLNILFQRKIKCFSLFLWVITSCEVNEMFKTITIDQGHSPAYLPELRPSVVV